MPARGWRQFVDFYSGDVFWERLRPELREGFASSPIDRWAALFANPTTLADVRRVQVPTLVLCGEHTTAPERRWCEPIGGRFRRPRWGLPPGAGHRSPVTHPKEVAGRFATPLNALAERAAR